MVYIIVSTITLFNWVSPVALKKTDCWRSKVNFVHLICSPVLSDSPVAMERKAVMLISGQGRHVSYIRRDEGAS